jgi:hypothetical protein
MSNNKKSRKNSVSEETSTSLGTDQLRTKASRSTENKFSQMLTRKQLYFNVYIFFHIHIDLVIS